jgi:hypothetical protein
MMESTQQRAEQATTPLKNAAGDLRRLQTAGSASVQELKEFLREHRGKSSQELLGELGRSSLMQAMIKSTIGCVALMAVLTVVPYLVQGEPQPRKSNSAHRRAAAEVVSPAAATSSTATNAVTSVDAGVPNGVDLEKAKKVMGLDETRSAPADINPREKDLDNLLDGVK